MKTHTRRGKQTHVKCVPCRHDIARPQIAGGEEGLHIWRAAANILNKQPQTVDKGVVLQLWGSAGGVTTPRRKKLGCYKMLHSASNSRWRALVNTVMSLRIQENVVNFLTS
jgi:hypothetical protein